ncbi:MAG: 50S ribosomal protein L9 [Actinobacteria bacterium]|nr:50S ribosomal protein L9 [Actinomycetota bacterium]
MKLILTQEVGGLGVPGDVVEVKDGYGRNFLVPRGKAMLWTKGGEKQITQIKRAQDAREVRDLTHAKEIKAQLEGLQVVVPARAGESGKLFGSVTNADVVAAVRKAGGPLLDKRSVDVGAVKAIGAHKAKVKVHPEVTAAVNFTVVAQ